MKIDTTENRCGEAFHIVVLVITDEKIHVLFLDTIRYKRKYLRVAVDKQRQKTQHKCLTKKVLDLRNKKETILDMIVYMLRNIHVHFSKPC